MAADESTQISVQWHRRPKPVLLLPVHVQDRFILTNLTDILDFLLKKISESIFKIRIYGLPLLGYIA